MFSGNNIFKKFQNQNCSTFIYGVGACGRILDKFCEDLDVRVQGFIDGNIKYDGNYVNGKKVIHHTKISKEHRDSIIVVSSNDIHDVVQLLIQNGVNENQILPGGNLLQQIPKSFELEDIKYNEGDTASGFSSFAIDCTILCHKAFESNDPLFIRSLDLVITERCSMKCKDCSNLMQYFQNPVNYEAGQLLQNVKDLLNLIGFIPEIRIIGGEPFMNRNACNIIQELIAEKRIHRIVVYTNGTIVPKKEDFIKIVNEKVVFMITDYSSCGLNAESDLTGRLVNNKKNTDKLEVLCLNHNLKYRRHPPENWTEAANIRNYWRTDDENQQIYDRCCCKNLYTLSEGEFHKCPFSAQMARLGKNNFINDFVTITGSDLKDEVSEIAKLIKRNKFLQICGFCPGRSLSDPQIEPAIQIKDSLEIPC